MVFVRPPLRQACVRVASSPSLLGEGESFVPNRGCKNESVKIDHVGYLAVISTLYNIILNYVVHNILTSNTQGFLVHIYIDVSAP